MSCAHARLPSHQLPLENPSSVFCSTRLTTWRSNWPRISWLGFPTLCSQQEGDFEGRADLFLCLLKSLVLPYGASCVHFVLYLRAVLPAWLLFMTDQVCATNPLRVHWQVALPLSLLRPPGVYVLLENTSRVHSLCVSRADMWAISLDTCCWTNCKCPHPH